MENALRSVGFDEADIKRRMDELVAAFRRSDEVGQAHWKRTRELVLRRRAAAEAWERAEQVEANAVQQLPTVRASNYVKKWTETGTRNGAIIHIIGVAATKGGVSKTTLVAALGAEACRRGYNACH
jgi:Mrp family chromosome partitioning ATPase